MNDDAPDTTETDEPMKVEADARCDAREALDRWLDECEREGTAAFACGRLGYIGRIKLCAFVNDDGIALRIERSFSEDL